MQSMATFALVILGFVPLFYGRAQEKDATQDRSAASSVVAPDLQELIHDYFDLYAKGEVHAILALWSQSSPELSKRRKDLEETGSIPSSTKISNMTMELLNTSGEVSKLRVRFTGKLPGQESATW